MRGEDGEVRVGAGRGRWGVLELRPESEQEGEGGGCWS